MTPGLRIHKRASLRIAIAQGLPPETWKETREIVSVASEDRCKGHASALLHQVCAEADREWITLILHVKPFADGMTAEQLAKFYSRFGFVQIQSEPAVLMARSPQRPKLARVH